MKKISIPSWIRYFGEARCREYLRVEARHTYGFYKRRTALLRDNRTAPKVPEAARRLRRIRRDLQLVDYGLEQMLGFNGVPVLRLDQVSDAVIRVALDGRHPLKVVWTRDGKIVNVIDGLPPVVRAIA